MSIQLNLGRDQQGEISYALDIIHAKKYNNSFDAGDETWIVLEDTDRTAIFLPSAGATYRISWESLPDFPITPSAPMQEANIVQNPAIIELSTWVRGTSGAKRLYIKSDTIQTMTVLVYQ